MTNQNFVQKLRPLFPPSMAALERRVKRTLRLPERTGERYDIWDLPKPALASDHWYHFLVFMKRDGTFTEVTNARGDYYSREERSLSPEEAEALLSEAVTG